MRTLQGATIIPALALILAFVVYEPAFADPAGDKRYLRLKSAERLYAQMADFAQMQGPLVEVSDRRELPAIVQRGAAVAVDVFTVDTASEAMRERLAAVPGDVPVEIDPPASRARPSRPRLS